MDNARACQSHTYVSLTLCSCPPDANARASYLLQMSHTSSDLNMQVGRHVLLTPQLRGKIIVLLVRPELVAKICIYDIQILDDTNKLIGKNLGMKKRHEHINGRSKANHIKRLLCSVESRRDGVKGRRISSWPRRRRSARVAHAEDTPAPPHASDPPTPRMPGTRQSCACRGTARVARRRSSWLLAGDAPAPRTPETRPRGHTPETCPCSARLGPAHAAHDREAPEPGTTSGGGRWTSRLQS